MMQKQLQSYQDSMREFYTINGETLRKLTDLQFGFFSERVTSSLEQAKILGSQTSYQDIIATGSQTAYENHSAILGTTRQTVDILNESREKIVDWFEKSVVMVPQLVKEVIPAITAGETKNSAKKTSIDKKSQTK